MNRLVHARVKQLVSWLLRGLLIIGRQPSSQTGFILPTTVLLLLVVVLTVGAIGYRTFTRTQQTIGERQQQVIYNAATPAIDRAKAKIEFMFDPDRDPRGGGVPSQTQLLGMMLNDGRDLGSGVTVSPLPGTDPYTIPGETRVDVNGDGKKDNAWRYRVDLDGDGNPNSAGNKDGWAVYSIVFTAPGDSDSLRDSRTTALQTRASGLLVRNAPLSNATQASTCQRQGDSGQVPLINSDGWFPDPVKSTKIRKNFQVDAYVLPDNANGTIATLEFQQDREATQGFKWAAWFRNDLEVFPGAPFNWNGAMHTEGNLIAGGGNNFAAYMISSQNSCLYTKDASEITAANVAANAEKGIPAFQGQFITGNMRENDTSGTPRFHLWTAPKQKPDTTDANIKMDSGKDSVAGNYKPADFALEPVLVQTQDISQSRNTAIANPVAARDGAWDGGKFAQAGRLVNAKQDTPYLDDTFRADNRYGPKPRFGRNRDPIPGKIGEPIAGNTELIGDDPLSGGDPASVGLDGYWERRARNEGLRLIVGQRLELGDPAGWGGPDPNAIKLEFEPLRPWQEGCAGARCSETRQRRNLWDNLAAVQATAVYHASAAPGKDFPAVCLATTIHPGTPTTLDKSATFSSLALGLPDDIFTVASSGAKQYKNQEVISDFFRGRGTNGWEFAVPPQNQFTDTNSTLMKALRNLATYAGDPDGGAPSFTPVAGSGRAGVVHPFPSMAMWGDFSMLRRVLDLAKTGGYSSLSPADKTTLHTAGCTLGMLAYNLDYLEKLDLSSAGPLSAELTDLKAFINYLDKFGDATAAPLPAGFTATLPAEIKNIGANPPSTTPLVGNFTTRMKAMAWDPTGSNNPETYVRLLEFWRDKATGANKTRLDKAANLAQLIITKEQVARDRQFGFLGQYGGATGSQNQVALAPLGDCDTWGWSSSADPTNPLGRLCSARPRYPILFSLFPAYDPTGNPPAGGTTIDNAYSSGYYQGHSDLSDNAMRYIVRDREDSTTSSIRNFISTANSGATYNVIRPEEIAMRPKKPNGINLGSTTAGTWVLPFDTSPGNGTTPNTGNTNKYNWIKVCDATTAVPCLTSSAPRLRVPFKDGAFYNGREMLSVRTLDIDLDLLRQSQDGLGGGDYWLPLSGIVYAFREDAISETHIVRPTSGADWSSCKTEAALQTANCQMNVSTVSAYASKDPPLNDSNAITPKPVDYYPDPDRRPNGFRLRQGATLIRGAGNTPNPDNLRGMSFITDNPAYIQGFFNLHRGAGETSTARTNRIEEFNEPLPDNFSVTNFYDDRQNLNLDFADAKKDQWRPTEVLADAVTVISDNFCDGSIQDGILTAGTGNGATVTNASYGCGTGSVKTSYLNQNRPKNNPTAYPAETQLVRWVRTNLVDSNPIILRDPGKKTIGEGSSPIFIARTGQPMKWTANDGYSDTYDNGGDYYASNENRASNTAFSGTTQNMIMVSGIVTSRANQSYGGLHNFPRFIENWSGKNLYLSGAFLQLNFSSYGAGAFDQDAWEPGATPVSGSGCPGGEYICYYGAPNRIWGYDVGLQYAPAGPVAQRFKFSEAIRSEYYFEPSTSDPYVQKLATCARGTGC
jgi:hypothetical protein